VEAPAEIEQQALARRIVLRRFLRSARFICRKGAGSLSGNLHRGCNGAHAAGRGSHGWRQQTAFEHFSA